MEEQFIGNYKILEKVGAGGMAKVYLAVHKDVPNLKVVLKILSDPRLADRFRQEADKLALLDGHPNICRIKHFFNHGDDLVIAMEYIDGRTLDEILEEKGKLAIEEALRITASVLSILEVAHEKDIYHRDIKPSNIMIDLNGNVKIIDFGIAKGKSDPNLTIAGTAAGTPSYMAPEQFTPDDSIEYARVDIYAVGTTLYKITTGKLPFEGDNEFTIRDAKLFNEAPKPSKLNSEISGRLENIIMKSLEKEPSARFNSAGEMKTIIEALISKQEPAPPSSDAKIKTARESAGKSKVVPISISIVAVIILFAATVYFLSNGEPEKTINQPAITPDTAVSIVGSPPAGSVKLSLIPSGDIYLDEILIGKGLTDTILTVDTGIHIIRVENSEAINKFILDTISLVDGEELPRRYSFEMAKSEPDKPIPKPEPVVVKEYGEVVIGSRPRGADIYIDGKLQNKQTPYTFPLETGPHEIKLLLSVDGEVKEHVETVNVTVNGQHKVLFKP